MILKCPVCGNPLDLVENGVRCTNGHAFDRAASGYFNLLLSKNKQSQNPGDSRDMVLARRRFLDAGYYAPLRNALVSAINELGVKSLLDAGCGEGYYTSAFSEIVADVVGVDLSKDAVLRASKRDKHTQYCVGSIFDLPVMSAEVITSIFAPYSIEEFSRVTDTVVAVIPGERHLWGLKEALYDTPYLNDEEGYQMSGFSLVDTVKVDFDVEIEGEEAIFDLFSMTPYYWKTPRDSVERLKKRDKLNTSASFRILVYKKG